MVATNKKHSLSETQVKALRNDVRKSRRQMEPFRKFRNEAIKQFVGKFYSDDGADQEMPINVLELGIMTYRSLMVAGDPAAMVSTTKTSLKPEADEIEQALDHVSSETKLGEALSRWVVDSMFAPLGILHVDLDTVGQLEIDGTLHDYHLPFATNVDFDDFVLDMQAKRLDLCHYFGHCYEWRKDLLAQLPWVDQEALKDIKPVGFQAQNETGESKAAKISRGDERTGEDDREFYEMILCWDIYLPMEGKIYTFAGKTGSEDLGECIGERAWNGPEGGPYVFLGYEYVPGQIMPLPPVATWRSLADMINLTWRKLADDHENQKTVAYASGSATEDATRVMKAPNGSVVTVNDANAIKEMRFRGVDGESFAFGIDLLGRWSWLAGNVDSLGGLSSQSETARGEQLIGQSASKRITFMAGVTRCAVAEVYKRIAWFVVYDPVYSFEITKKVEGTEIELPGQRFTPAEMEGDYLDFNFDIQPYSRAEQTPQSQLASLQLIMREFIMPLQQQMQAEDKAINIEGLLKLVAKLLGFKDLSNLVQFSQMAVNSEPPARGEPPRKAAHTSREYVRSSQGMTPGAADQQMIQSLLARRGQQQ